MKRTRKNIAVGLMLAVMLTAGTGVSAAGTFSGKTDAVLTCAALCLRQGISAGDRDGDGICDRRQFADQDGDGICDRNQFVDQDGDGICDRSQFVDQDGDGICDRKNSSGQQCQGQGQGNAGKRNGAGRWGQKG
ncbi:MAG: hypothetical protein ACOX60_11670 [Massiliimalia sp.]